MMRCERCQTRFLAKMMPLAVCKKCVLVRELWRMVQNYTNAKEKDTWKGSGDPNESPAIEKRLKESRSALQDGIRKLVEDAL